MPKSLLPKDFGLSPQVREWARLKLPQVDLGTELEKFCDYWWGCGRQMLDWDATLKNWLRRSVPSSPTTPKAIPRRTLTLDPVNDGWVGDRWDIRANRALLAFILHKIGTLGVAWSAQQKRAVGILIGYKKAWAQDMREWEGEPSHAEQAHNWRECMKRAQAQIGGA